MVKYNDQISRYITELFADQDDILRQVRTKIEKRGLPPISVRPEEGRFLQFLVRSSGAKKAIELGSLGGYSGTWIARGLPPDGKLLTIEKDPLHAEIAREHFAKAGVGEIVEVRLGEAQALLSALTEEGPFDFIFIDADKAGYNDYFIWGIQNTPPGGVIAAHNAFRGFNHTGRYNNDSRSQAILTLNRRIASDPRVISTIFPAGDGTLVAVKVEGISG